MKEKIFYFNRCIKRKIDYLYRRLTKKKEWKVSVILNDWKYDVLHEADDMDNRCGLIVNGKLRGKNLSIITNTPGILIGYHGKFSEIYLKKLRGLGLRVDFETIDKYNVHML